MGKTAAARSLPGIDPRRLRTLESHFIANDIYRRGDASDRQARIARLVAHDIVPRLLHLHSEIAPNAPSAVHLVEALSPGTGDVNGLADIVLGSDLEAAISYISVLRDRGLALDTLFVEVLEPTARRLGTMWDNDDCNFIDVTLGVARLQKLLAIFNETHMVPEVATKRRVLMAMTPSDQHSFGVTMVEQFLSAAGWQVQTEIAASVGEIIATASSSWFAVIGLTAGSTDRLATLRKLIPALRTESLNARVGIMVGGPTFTADPSLASTVGADATACNAPAAVLVAQKLFDLMIAADPA